MEEASKTEKPELQFKQNQKQNLSLLLSLRQNRLVVLESGDDFEVKSIPNIRKLIANAMHQSLQNSAQLTHHMSADARQVMKLRKKFKKEYTEGTIKQNVTINDLVCFAVIRAFGKISRRQIHTIWATK